MNKILTALLFATTFVSRMVYAYENPLFGYTHLQPSPYTLPAGTILIGTDLAFGLTDFLTVGTSLIGDLSGVYNAHAKISVLDTHGFAAALTMGWQHYNLHDLDTRNPNVDITSYLPGAVTSFALLDELALFTGGNLRLSKVSTQPGANASATYESGLVRGGTIGSDLSYAYQFGERGVGNVISAGAIYDFTYRTYGVGLSHHWRGFHLGATYYPGADQYPIVPIVSGGLSFQVD